MAEGGGAAPAEAMRGAKGISSVIVVVIAIVPFVAGLGIGAVFLAPPPAPRTVTTLFLGTNTPFPPLEFRNSKGGKGVFVPRKRVVTVRGAGGGARNTAPMPRPATNGTMAMTTTMTLEIPFAPRIASAGAAPPPSAMRGANTCPYLSLTASPICEQQRFSPLKYALTWRLGGNTPRARRGLRRGRPLGCSMRGCIGGWTRRTAAE